MSGVGDMAGWTLVVSRQEVARAPAQRVFGLPHPRLAGHVLTYAAHDYPWMDLMPWRDRPLVLEQAGPSRGIAIAMTPMGAYALFGLPLRELANTNIGLADLVGADAHLLIEQLAESPRLARAIPGAGRLPDSPSPAWTHIGQAGARSVATVDDLTRAPTHQHAR